jgi:uroporphyrin-III C-methyltransferase
VITGTTSARKLSTDALAAQSTATVVILMGMSKLDQIVALFQKSRKAKCPAIIQKTTAAEKVGIGTVNTIQSVVAAKSLSSPAIVIGEVVRDAKRNAAFTRN